MMKKMRANAERKNRRRICVREQFVRTLKRNLGIFVSHSIDYCVWCEIIQCSMEVIDHLKQWQCFMAINISKWVSLTEKRTANFPSIASLCLSHSPQCYHFVNFFCCSSVPLHSVGSRYGTGANVLSDFKSSYYSFVTSKHSIEIYWLQKHTFFKWQAHSGHKDV